MLTRPETEVLQASDADLVARLATHDEAAIRSVVKRYNQRLYRLARSVLKDDGDAEDAVQQAYVKAFAGIGQFRGEAALGTWLSRIVINVALDSLRRRRTGAVAADEESEPKADPVPDPERSLAQRQIQAMIERAIDDLPDTFRMVIVARLVEGMSIEETAEALGLRPETVKTRLHRAREQVKQALERQLGPAVVGVFPFLGPRCEHMADAVVAKIREDFATR